MESKFNINIPKPCQENWNNMTTEETGKFCSVCTKSVIDFTHKSNVEIQDFFIKNQERKVCGRFRNEQVNKFDIQIPKSVLRQSRSYQKSFLLALFVVMGTTLFSCKNHNDHTLGEVVVVEDTIQVNHTTGFILPPKDSIQRGNITVGDVKYNPNDTSHIPPPPSKTEQIKFIKQKEQTKKHTPKKDVIEIGEVMGIIELPAEKYLDTLKPE